MSTSFQHRFHPQNHGKARRSWRHRRRPQWSGLAIIVRHDRGGTRGSPELALFDRLLIAWAGPARDNSRALINRDNPRAAIGRDNPRAAIGRDNPRAAIGRDIARATPVRYLTAEGGTHDGRRNHNPVRRRLSNQG
jgi:hypothetical protein